MSSPPDGPAGGFRYRDIVRRLGRGGFVFARHGRGSHEIWHNRDTGLFTVIPNHPGDMPEGTLRAILKQADISADAFLAD